MIVGFILLHLIVFTRILHYSSGISGSGSGVELPDILVINCTLNPLQLVNGSSSSSGRIEVCYAGAWGTVCDDFFGFNDGDVICKQLGFIGVLNITKEFGPGTGPIWLDDLDCDRTESSVFDCSSRPIGDPNDCQHSEDVGVICQDNCDQEQSIRLADSSSSSSGRVEICHHGTWGTVCNISFSVHDGNVICHHLGFPLGVEKLTNAFGPGLTETAIWLGDFDCEGTESSLLECMRAEFFSVENWPYCQHDQDIGVECRLYPPPDECENGTMKFRFQILYNEGIPQLCVYGVWAVISAYTQHFNDAAARVTCRQLGYENFHDYILAWQHGQFYQFYNDDSLDQRPVPALNFDSIGLNCNGSESRLYDCKHGNPILREAVITYFIHGIILDCFNNILLLTNSTTVSLGPDRIQETINFTCIANVTHYEIEWTWVFKTYTAELKPIPGDDELRYNITKNISNAEYGLIALSTLEILNPHKTDEGRYYCFIDYLFYEPHEAVNQTHYLKFEAELSISVPEENNRMLNCELTGYILSNATAVVFQWFRNSTQIQTTNPHYNITTSNGNSSQDLLVNSEGEITQSIIISLYIYTTDVAGEYECVVLDGNYSHSGNLYSANITLQDSHDEVTSSTSSVTTSVTTVTSSSSRATTPTDSSQIQSEVIAGIALAGSVVIIFGLICCMSIPLLLKKLKSSSQDHALNFEKDDFRLKVLSMKTNSQHNEKLNKMDLLSCVIDPSDLKLMEKIGQGEFGLVYRGVLRKDSSVMPVAIKTVRGLYSESQLIDDLLLEADKMKSFDHFHILSLTGVCVGLLESPCIVMPFMSNGSLLSYLRREAADLTINEMVDENVFNSVLKHLLSTCLQVAKGMDYLSQQKFIHRDLAARNCMISSEGIIKIADFGLAEDIYTTEYFKLDRSQSDDAESVKLPLKWMALESIHLGMFDEKTDVWSYGVLCWEVFNGGKTPYPGSTPNEVVTMLDNGERLTKPTNAACTEDVYSIMLSCWEKSPKCRPRFFELVENINKLLVPLADYLDLAPDFKINENKYET